jgi:hypothetical protein
MATKSASAPKTTQPSLLSTSLAKGKALSQDRDIRNMGKGIGLAVLGYCVYRTVTGS